MKDTGPGPSQGSCFGGGYEGVLSLAGTLLAKKPASAGWQDTCRAMGGRLSTEPHSKWTDSDTLSVSDKTGFTFFLPAESRILDDFFSTRALAHHLIHFNGDDEIRFPINGGDMRTLESIWFSLALLLPDRLFSTLASGNGSDDHIALAMGVPAGLVTLKRKILSAVDRDRPQPTGRHSC